MLATSSGVPRSSVMFPLPPARSWRSAPGRSGPARSLGSSARSRARSGSLAEGVEALAVELLGQLRAAGLDDPAVDEDVHLVGRQVVEDPAVVGDQQDAQRG